MDNFQLSFFEQYFQVLSAKLPIKIETSYCKFIK